METFIITSQLTKKGYAKAIIIGLYKKPLYIFAMIMGLFLLSFRILDYCGIVIYIPEDDYLDIFVIVFTLFAPFFSAGIYLLQAWSNKNTWHDTTYTFSDNGLVTEGLTCNAEYQWEHFAKWKIFGDYLLLYHTNNLGNYIEKSKLSPVQLEFVKSKIKKK